MKKLLIVLVIISSGFSQVNWTYEIVDSVPGATYDYYFNSLAIDRYGIPHIVYNKDEFNKVIYASRVGSVWQKETVESGLFYYSFSLMFDDTNIPHLSYYKRDDALNKTYICYARRDGTGWLNEAVDSSTGSLGNYFWDFYSSIDIDTSGLPGIAYIAWHVEDSLHYIKYAHYNGIDWDTSIVARDTAWAHRYPLDWSPSLKFDRKSTPHIAFHRIRGQTDTVKIGYYDDTLNTWIVEPAICWPYGGYPVSLALNSQDYPCIAHGLSVAVAYSWWDGLSWHTETTGATMGWVGVRIVLDLDSLDNPHILYRMDFSPVDYCYKRNNVWHINNWVGQAMDNISFSLDNNDNPHVCFNFFEYDSSQQIDINILKYAKGNFTGVEEKHVIKFPNVSLACSPNLIRTETLIKYTLDQKTKISLNLYDNSGRLVKRIFDGEKGVGIYTETVSLRNYPSGIYHLLLKTPDSIIKRKIVFIK